MQKRKKFLGLSDAERSEISILKERGCSVREIARALGRSPNTVSYELKHNSVDGIYDPLKAKQKSRVARRSRRYQQHKIERNVALREYVVAGLESGWNPDEISGAMKQTNQPFYVSKTVIYDWLYSSYGQPYCQYLPSQRYRPKTRRTNPTERVMIPDRVSVGMRPLGATNRTRYGHWEGDTVVSGKRTGSKAALAVAQERKTKLIGALLIPDLRPVSFARATTAILASKKALSLTLDNGIENKQHAAITDATGVRVFFCDPYSSWQKGGVEHANKMLRRYLPKGCDLGNFDQTFVDAVVDRLNKKPRKILGYKSALQCAVEKGII
jgi:transposase, IS30 family